MTTDYGRLIPVFHWRLVFLLPFFTAALPAQSSAVFINSIIFEGNKAIGRQQLKKMLQFAPEGSQYAAGLLASALGGRDLAHESWGDPLIFS
jgi:hypothetical protein